MKQEVISWGISYYCRCWIRPFWPVTLFSWSCPLFISLSKIYLKIKLWKGRLLSGASSVWPLYIDFVKHPLDHLSWLELPRKGRGGICPIWCFFYFGQHALLMGEVPNSTSRQRFMNLNRGFHVAKTSGYHSPARVLLCSWRFAYHWTSTIWICLTFAPPPKKKRSFLPLPANGGHFKKRS